MKHTVDLVCWQLHFTEIFSKFTLFKNIITLPKISIFESKITNVQLKFQFSFIFGWNLTWLLIFRFFISKFTEMISLKLLKSKNTEMNILNKIFAFEKFIEIKISKLAWDSHTVNFGLIILNFSFFSIVSLVGQNRLHRIENYGR